MAHLWLLLKLRWKLALRRYSGKRFTLAAIVLVLAMFGAAAVWIGHELDVRWHGYLSARASAHLFDLTALVVTVFVTIGPLMGFRGNEFLDVSKLFHYPIRPLWVFLSSAIGNLCNASTLFFLPILLLPALAVASADTSWPAVVSVTLAYLTTLYLFVQCITLVFLNVLRSRRFRDLVAILAPVVGMGSYLALRWAIAGGDGVGRAPEEIERFLEGLDFEPGGRFLPPFWYGAILREGGATAVRGLLALGGLAAALVVAGVHLTTRAFHGEVAIAAPEATVREERGLLRRAVASVLPAAAAAVYVKELAVLRREPWFRMLFLQQLGLVVLICLGRGLWNGQDEAEHGLQWAAAFLVFVETGFLLNILGFEGRALQQTASLPATCFQILLGKNAAYLQILGVTNLLVVPGLALLSSYVAGEPLSLGTTVLSALLAIVVLPAVVGLGNLASVLMPSPIGTRGRRALGQERAGNEGCLAALGRMLVSIAALVPAVAVAAVVAAPIVFLDRGMGTLFWCASLPAGVLLALAIWLAFTRPAATYWQRHMAAVLGRLV